MNVKNLTRMFFFVLTVGLVSFAPSIRFFLPVGAIGGPGVAAEVCPQGPCPVTVCNTVCNQPPTACVGCTTITPCNMLNLGWAVQIITDSQTCPSTGSIEFNTGPACVPASTGSLELIVGPDGNSDVRLRQSDYNGTKLSDLTTLSYCTYVQYRNPNTFIAPYLALTVDLNGNNQFDGFGIDDVLFFEPLYQTGTYQTFDANKNLQIPSFAGEFYPVQDDGTVATCQWKCWDAKVGAWWSGSDFIAAGGDIPAFTTLQNFFGRLGNSNASILNPDACQGGVQIRAGEGAPTWDCFVGNVDKFTIAVGNSVPASSVTYDFEPADCPIPECGSSAATAITACKYYDKNADGTQDPEDLPIDGWPITIDPLGSGDPPATKLTIAGCVSWGNLSNALNPYTVTEGTPIQTNWVHSTPSSVQVNVVLDETSQVTFGNYCTVGSGGRTIGFWGNKNGQALITAADLLLLRNCNLVKKDGTAFDPTSANQVKQWLQDATATNMAYMLSAQLAAMKLNVAHGFVDGANFSTCAGTTINQLILDADALLLADGLTPSGDPNRAPQEAAKNCLDSLNNGASVISATPCPATFPAPPLQASRVSAGTKFSVGASRTPKLIVP
jgi:hypothetical protein